jgi:ABC-type glutathione transport system ATPase component
MLALENIVKEYPIEGGVFRRRIGLVVALKGVSLEVPEGSCVGLVGESGCGKTTLARIVAGFTTASRGRVLWEEKPADGVSRRAWAGRVQMIFQDPTASLNPKLPVRVLVGEAVDARAFLDGERLSPAERLRRMETLLSEVGLAADALSAFPHQFSGGQRQRLAIARALSMRPQLLLADEPVSSLDLSVQAQILNLLLELKQRRRLSLLLISHDLAVVARLADRVAVMQSGDIVEQGETSRILSAPSHPYTKKLLGAVPAFLK